MLLVEIRVPNNSEKQETMKKTIHFLAGLILFSALSFSFVAKTKSVNKPELKTEAAGNVITKAASTRHNHALDATNMSSFLFTRLKLNEKGLSRNALEVALKGYLHLQEQGVVKNTELLSVVDFSQSSRKKRFYLIDVKNSKLLVNTYVAHGKNSGLDKTESFSNIPESEQSSLGFYVTKGTYTGKNGFSLRMAGVDKGFNDNAEKRAIVVHGADYVNAGRVSSAYMGRSQGCPALPREKYMDVINLIKDGSVFFVYSPDTKYLSSSEILNAG